MVDLQRFAEEAETETTNEANVEEQTEAQPELKYSDADVDRIVQSKLAKEREKQQKAIDEAQKLAEMNAQQKVEYERDQLKAQLDSLQAEVNKSNMLSTARTMIAEAGISSVNDDLVSVLVTGDAETTQANVEAFIKNYQASVQAEVAKAVAGNTPSTGGVAQMTKADILNIKNTAERQKAIRDNIELFT